MIDTLPKELQWVWNARWASYWTGDKELFDYSDRDFEEKARALAAAGVNAVITFGGFHFRWSFVDEWPMLLEMLKKIVESCHNYGIKVIEHHSAILTHNPQGEKEWEWTKFVRGNISSGKVELERHPGFMKGIKNGDLQYKGIWLSQMRQIDPRTGQFSRTNYRGWALCFNNPLYQKLYFEHLEKIYACGVDGIMTDDIQFWPVGYGCGCPYCREKFTSNTKYEMPPNGLDDKNFYGNMNNPAYRAWVLWRTKSTAEHHRRVTSHFRKLGLELCRPLYSSSDTSTWAIQGLGGGVENNLDICSTIFTEVCSVEAQGHCWVRVGAEAKHRSALSYRQGVPPMCLFYPHNKQENLLDWALTKSWGQNYWGTRNELSLKEETEMMQPVFSFENAHPEIYEKPEPISEVGILFSSRTRTLYKGMNDRYYVQEWAGWCEALMRANIPFDTIIDPDLEEKRYFERLKLIILPNTALLGEAQIQAVEEFVKEGGKLILTHESGLYNEEGSPYKEYPFSDIIGADYIKTKTVSLNWELIQIAPEFVPKAINGKEAVVLLKEREDAKVWMRFKGTNSPALIYHRYGKGEVITFAGKPGTINYIASPSIYRPDPENPNLVDHYIVNYDRDEDLANLMIGCVKNLLGGNPLLITEGVPDGILVSAFKVKKGIAVHLVNVAGTLSDNHKEIPVASPLNFPNPASLAGGSSTMRIKIRCKEKNAVLLSPEFKKEDVLNCEREGEYIVIKVPSQKVHCYSAVSVW